jgi:hypothetical protein
MDTISNNHEGSTNLRFESLSSATAEELAEYLNEEDPAFVMRARFLLKRHFSDSNTPLSVLESFRESLDTEVAFCSTQTIITRIENGMVSEDDLKRFANGDDKDEQFSVGWTAKHFLAGTRTTDELLRVAVDERIQTHEGEQGLAETIIHKALSNNGDIDEMEMKRFTISPETFSLVLIKLASEDSVSASFIPLIMKNADKLKLGKNFFTDPHVQKLAVDVVLTDYLANGHFDEVLAVSKKFGLYFPEEKYLAAIKKYRSTIPTTPEYEDRIAEFIEKAGLTPETKQ